jgi:hypothetical protein
MKQTHDSFLLELFFNNYVLTISPHVLPGIGLSRWTIILVEVPTSDIGPLPEQQARYKNIAKGKNL